MTSSVIWLRRIGALALVASFGGELACSSNDEGSSPGNRGGSSNTGGTTGSAGNGGSTVGGTGGATTGGSGGSTGGTTGSGGVAGKAGASGSGGAAGTTGPGGAAGMAGAGGTAGGPPGTAGSSGGAGKAGAAGSGGTGGVADAGVSKDASTPPTDAGGARFSFFVVSQAAMKALSGNEKGFGGDLRFGEADGLTGADKICTQTAERGMPGNGKTWRAFLSATKGPGGSAQVNAIDRIGAGPWYDRQGRLFAMTTADLLNARPKGADPGIINDFPNENGVPNQTPDGTGTQHDNHATLTGSGPTGTLWTSGLAGTCQDWTNATAAGGKPHVGYTFPRGTTNHWISIMDEPGCLPGGTITQTGGADPNDPSVGSSGGYGAFYCFALTP